MLYSDFEAYTSTSEVYQNLNLSDQFAGNVSRSLLDTPSGGIVRDFAIDSTPSVEIIRYYIHQGQSDIHTKTNLAWKPLPAQELRDFFQHDRDIKLNYRPVLDVYRSRIFRNRGWHHFDLVRNFYTLRNTSDVFILNKQTGQIVLPRFSFNRRYSAYSYYTHGSDRGGMAIDYIYGRDKTDTWFALAKRYTNAFVEFQALVNLPNSAFGLSGSSSSIQPMKESKEREMNRIIQEIESTNIGIL